MDNRADGSGAIVAVALVVVFILLTLGGGAGVYVFFMRQHMSMAERARQAEAEARMMAELARAEAEAAMRAERAARGFPAAAEARTDSADAEPLADLRTSVESVLRAQEEAWNKGDVDAFMEHYWKSDDLTFSSEGKTTRGWTATLERYRTKYPTPEKMGRLKLSDLEVTSLGASAALVLGKWNLERETEPVGGNFSLVVRKFDDRWLIVHDHTSRLAE